MPLGHVPKSRQAPSPGGVPKVKNDVNLPNFIARSKQKDKGAKQNGHKKQRQEPRLNVNHTKLTKAHIEVSLHLSKQLKKPICKTSLS
jgi:hypothetical protein